MTGGMTSAASSDWCLVGGHRIGTVWGRMPGGTMHHADRRLRFATTRIATGLQLHYAEQGDPGGETILFLPAYADS
jgi:hypothetical protein